MKNFNSELEHALNKLGLTLPTAPEPIGNYKACTKAGNLLYISGQLPIFNGEVKYKGALGKDLTVAQGQEAAQLCALNILSQLKKYLDAHRIKQLIKVEGFINATSKFEEHAQVLNGASDLFAHVLAERAGHIRTVVGCSSLPMNVPLEISVIVELEEKEH